MAHTWEQLDLLAQAHGRRDAGLMQQLMVAAQGDEKSWNALRQALQKTLKT